MKNTTLIEMRNYDAPSLIGDELEILDDILDYGKLVSDVSIVDTILSFAEDAIPISYDAIWANARKISEFIDDAVNEGLVGLNDGIIKVIQGGYYSYYSSVLLHNSDELFFNYIAELINEFIIKNNLSILNAEELESMIDERLDDLDVCPTFNDLDHIALFVASKIKL